MRRVVLAVAATLLATAVPAPAPAQDEPRIVYSGYRYRGPGAGSGIFTIVPGGERARLTGSKSFNVEPVWSPDRTRVAYVHHARPRNPDIWVMDADGGNKVRLTSGRSDDVSPQWSPDGSHIAWVKTPRGDWRGRIYVMHPDGEDRMAVSPRREDASMPAWSPDGRSIAYIHSRFCNDCEKDYEISVADAHSPGPTTTITDNDLHDVNPVWSPDGSRIVFTRDHVDGSDLFTIAPDGSDERQLTTIAGFPFLPRWSPDGSEIAFTLRVDAYDFELRLGIVTVATGEERLITESEAGGLRPHWSPDGSRIAFLGFHSGGYNLGVIARDGTGLTQVTDSEIDEAWLDW